MEKQLDKHFGFRLLCIFLVWISLGNTLDHSANQQSFFSALILYLLPLAVDYNGLTPKEKRNKKRQSLGMWSSLICAVIFFGLLLSGLNFEPIIFNKWVKFIIWCLCFIYVCIAVIDWIAYSSPEEIKHRERIRKLQRENSHESFSTRVEYYKKKNTEFSQASK